MLHEVRRLHAQYGNFVRLGPNEISVACPEALRAIHSNASLCMKGPWYNVFVPTISVHAIRDHVAHGIRRKIWEQAMSPQALQSYEPRVARSTQLLLNHIEQMAGAPVDTTEWINYFGFDVMGDLTFGDSFHMLETGERHEYMELSHRSTLWGSQFGRVSWLFQIIKSTPILNHEIINFLEWLGQRVAERKKKKLDRVDLFSWILDGYYSGQEPTKQDELNLVGDAHLSVVAGSDTVAGTLTALLMELAKHPEVQAELQRELDVHFADGDNSGDNASLGKLAYLQAVFDEAMRLYPAIPSGVQRLTPPQGLQIADTFIPGNTIVQIPTYTVNRDARCFEYPNSFIPERWTSRPDLVRNAKAFGPFSLGRYSCVGKPLGLMEMRYVVSRIVSRYDIHFAENQTAAAFLEGITEGFTACYPPLNLEFRARKS